MPRAPDKQAVRVDVAERSRIEDQSVKRRIAPGAIDLDVVRAGDIGLRLPSPFISGRGIALDKGTLLQAQ